MLNQVSNSRAAAQVCASAAPLKPSVTDKVILATTIPLGTAGALAGLTWATLDKPVVGALVGGLVGIFASTALELHLYPDAHRK